MNGLGPNALEPNYRLDCINPTPTPTPKIVPPKIEIKFNDVEDPFFFCFSPIYIDPIICGIITPSSCRWVVICTFPLFLIATVTIFVLCCGNECS